MSGQAKGIIAILTDKSGHVVAVGADFEAGSTRDMQEQRAENACAMAMGRAAIWPELLGLFEGWRLRELMRQAIRTGVFQFRLHAVGWPE